MAKVYDSETGSVTDLSGVDQVNPDEKVYVVRLHGEETKVVLVSALDANEAREKAVMCGWVPDTDECSTQALTPSGQYAISRHPGFRGFID